MIDWLINFLLGGVEDEVGDDEGRNNGEHRLSEKKMFGVITLNDVGLIRVKQFIMQFNHFFLFFKTN